MSKQSMNLQRILIVHILMVLTGFGNSATKLMKENKNPLICDPVSGICALPDAEPVVATDKVEETEKPVHFIYATDPICSACWAIEPQLRRLKLEYGHVLKIDYRMGGMLPNWSYNRGGISKPSDVAHHWDEVSAHYQMPIVGDVWGEDPLDSSYPPSIAFKAAQLQSEAAAQALLRVMREMVFLEKKNIARWQYLEEAGQRAALHMAEFKYAYDNRAKELFEADMKLVRSMRVGGFPTVVIVNRKGESVSLIGIKQYSEYVKAILELYPEATPQTYNRTGEGLFDYYPTLTEREFTELSQLPEAKALPELKRMTDAHLIEPLTTRNGKLWKKIK
jgi:predicted DsbA family dithiol-disulfide isomerase